MSCEYAWVPDRWTHEVSKCGRVGYREHPLTGQRLCSSHWNHTVSELYCCDLCQKRTGKQWKMTYRCDLSMQLCRTCADRLIPPKSEWGEHCALRECEHCGRFGGPNRVRYRHDCSVWDREDGELFPSVLCVGCWNKIKPKAATALAVIENSKLINKIFREIRNVRRTQSN